MTDEVQPNVEESDLEMESVAVDDDHDDAQVVRKMSMEDFRDKLVTHFDIAFQRKEIQWPKRNKKKN